MELHDQAEEPPEPGSNVISKITGTAIACLTLAMPLYVTAYYSSTRQLTISPQFLQPSIMTNRPYNQGAILRQP